MPVASIHRPAMLALAPLACAFLLPARLPAVLQPSLAQLHANVRMSEDAAEDATFEACMKSECGNRSTHDAVEAYSSRHRACRVRSARL